MNCSLCRSKAASCWLTIEPPTLQGWNDRTPPLDDMELRAYPFCEDHVEDVRTDLCAESYGELFYGIAPRVGPADIDELRALGRSMGVPVMTLTHV
jgi:hypothetical protein